MKLTVLVVSLFLCISCAYVARKGYGAKAQKIENKHTILQWLTRNGLDTSHVVSSSPEHYYDFVPGLTQAPLLFDKRSGNFLAIGFSNGKYCPKEIDKSFSSLPPYEKMIIKPASFIISEAIIIPPGVSIKDKDKFESKKDTFRINLESVEQKLTTLTGNTIDRNTEPESDYTLILPFAIFLGDKLQVEDLRKYYFSAIANKSAKIHVVFLNLDKQEWWGEEWNKKINIGY